jgi:uncharacterized caspase-like protein
VKKMRKFFAAIALSALSVVAAYGQAQGRLFCVAVGVSKYRDPNINNLNWCHKDANDFHNVMRLRTPAANTRLLTDERATRSSIIQTGKALFSQAGPKDTVIFYFSGHGNHDLFCAHDQLMPFHEVRDMFRVSKAGRKMIFADSCHSGSIRVPAPSANSNRNVNLGQSVMLFLSSRAAEQSLETRGGGLFTKHLIAGLKGSADANRDRIITARELFAYVNPRVRNESRGMGRQYEHAPVMWGKFDNNMPVVYLR